MINVKDEHFQFDKLDSMLQNDKRNSFHWVVQRRRTRKENYYLKMYHESNIHSSVYYFFFKEDNVSNDLLGFSKTCWSINQCNTNLLAKQLKTFILDENQLNVTSRLHNDLEEAYCKITGNYRKVLVFVRLNCSIPNDGF